MFPIISLATQRYAYLTYRDSFRKKLVSTFVTSCNHKLTEVCEIDGVRKITLSDPKTRNALSCSMMEELLDHVSSGLDGNSLRCIIIAANGPVFSSGHNLKELIICSKHYKGKTVFSLCSTLMNRIIDVPVPVIAAVNGAAVAAGCQLVAQCDIVVCTENSTFSTPGSHYGVFCSTPGIPLVRAVPRKIAAHMLMTGKPITAQQALQSGLVSKVVPANKLDDEINNICDAIKSQSKSIVALGKKFFYQQMELDIRAAYRLGEDLMHENVQLTDGQEGITSFAEKRKPTWQHDFSTLNGV